MALRDFKIADRWARTGYNSVAYAYMKSALMHINRIPGEKGKRCRSLAFKLMNKYRAQG